MWFANTSVPVDCLTGILQAGGTLEDFYKATRAVDPWMAKAAIALLCDLFHPSGAPVMSWKDMAGRQIIAEETHRCDEFVAADQLLSQIQADAAAEDDVPDQLLYGPAIRQIDRCAGKWYAHNNEYSSMITHCPFCGLRLPDE